MANVLTSALFKSRLQDSLAFLAEKGSEKAAPVVLEAVREIGFQNTRAIIQGGPTAATDYLRGQMGDGLVTRLLPEMALRIANNGDIGRLADQLIGVNSTRIAAQVSEAVDSAIWREIGVEESAIRADPQATNDLLLIAVFGVGSRL